MDKNIRKFPHQQPELCDLVHEHSAIGIYNESYSKEMELRLQEIEIQKQETEHSFQFSKVALEMQMADRNARRIHSASLQRNTYLLIGVLFIGVVSLITASLVLNKETIALELIKMTVYISAGGIGGYGISKENKKNQNEKESE